MGDPRKANFSLPADYIDKPASQVRSWLQSNSPTIRMLDPPAITARVRSVLGMQIRALNDADLAVLVDEWARNNGIAPSNPAPRGAPGEPEILAQLKKTFGAIPTSIKLNRNNVGGEISVSGATATIRTGPMVSAVSRGWGGNFELKTQVPGAAFVLALDQKDWRMSLTFGSDLPDLSSLDGVFRKGEAAMRGALANIDKLDMRNPAKSKQILTPYLDPIKSAVTAAARSASARQNSVNVGVWTGSSPSTGATAGIQLTIVF